MPPPTACAAATMAMTQPPPPRRPTSARLGLALLLAVACGLAACGRSVDDRLGQVRSLIDKQDRAGALVSVKSLLQEQPDLGPARLLLGQLLLDRGEAAAATIELRRALELQVPESDVLPPLARALLMDKPNNAVLSVLYGGFAPSTQGHARPFGMPPFMLELSNAQIAQVLSYTRSAWGNQALPISELQVQAVRDPQQRR